MNTPMTNFLLSAGKKYGQPVSVLCRATTPMAIIYMTILWPPTHGHSMTKLDTHPENLCTTILQPDNIILQYRWFIVSILLLFHLLYNLVHQSTASIYPLISSYCHILWSSSLTNISMSIPTQLQLLLYYLPSILTPKYITTVCLSSCHQTENLLRAESTTCLFFLVSIFSSSRYKHRYKPLDHTSYIHLPSSWIPCIHPTVFISSYHNCFSWAE